MNTHRCVRTNSAVYGDVYAQTTRNPIFAPIRARAGESSSSSSRARALRSFRSFVRTRLIETGIWCVHAKRIACVHSSKNGRLVRATVYARAYTYLRLE